MRKLLMILFVLFTVFSLKAQNTEIEKLWKELNRGKTDQVIEEGAVLLAKDPNNIEINNLMGRAYYGKGDYEIAIPYLEKSTLTNDPRSYTKAWGYNFLGKCYLSKGELEQAMDYFNKSYEMKATKNVTKSSYMVLAVFGFLDYYENWNKIENDHFIFYFQSNNRIEQFVKSREEAFDSISTYLNVNLEKKIRYFVWSSREDAKKVLNAELGFAKPEYYLIHSAFNQTRGHEMTHIISHYITDIKFRTRLINEGLAIYLDLADKNDRNAVLEAMKKYKIKKISMLSFWNEWHKYSDEISYPLSGLFVGEMIDKYGKDKFFEFFSNQSYENAKTVFGKDFDTFIKEFEDKF